MFPKFCVVALLVSTVPFAAASPNPAPTAAAEPDLVARQNGPGDVFSSLTSAAASVLTVDGASVFSQATSAAGSVASEVTSAVGGVGGSILTRVTSAAGSAFTVVTSVGGEGFTLATSGAGVVTSALGSVYTVATAAAQPTNTNNAAVGMHAASFGSPAIAGLVTVVGSALLGAIITL